MRPICTALIGSGSSCCFLSSSKISAVWYGDDDQMIFKRGKARVSSAILDCKSCGLLAVLSVVV